MNKEKQVPTEEFELAQIREELATISVALSILAIQKLGAADASERKRHDLASRKSLDLLLKRLEADEQQTK